MVGRFAIRLLLLLGLSLVGGACDSESRPEGAGEGDRRTADTEADLPDMAVDAIVDTGLDAEPGDIASDSSDLAGDTRTDGAALDQAGDLPDGDATGPDTAADDLDADAAEVTDLATEADESDGAASECTTHCDCDQGEACRSGVCVLEDTPVFCCTNPDCPDESFCVGASGANAICGAALSDAFGDIVFNEVLIDGASDGDANGDGEAGDPVGDEFVELVNRSGGTLDLTGYVLVETTIAALPRHTFGVEGAGLADGTAIVVFGGGSAPDDAPGVRYVTANAADPGIPFGLSLENDGEVLRLLDAEGSLVAVFAYGAGRPLEALTDESYSRPGPPEEASGFVTHTSLAPGVPFSPGTHADGSSF